MWSLCRRLELGTECLSMVADERSVVCGLGRKLLTCSHSQELSQCADLASDWLFILLQPIRSLVSPLTQLLT